MRVIKERREEDKFMDTSIVNTGSCCLDVETLKCGVVHYSEVIHDALH